jgi:hypothetical protein
MGRNCSITCQDVNSNNGVYDVNLLEKAEMDVDLPTLFRVIGWSFVVRFLGSPPWV